VFTSLSSLKRNDRQVDLHRFRTSAYPGISPLSMDQSSTSQSNRQSRRPQATKLPAPAPSILSTKPLYPTNPLPTIATLDAASSRYPTRSAVPPVQNPVLSVEDELHSESECQQGDAKQETGEGTTTSDFVKKLYRWEFEPQLELLVINKI
jgi:hypothetical protein